MNNKLKNICTVFIALLVAFSLSSCDFHLSETDSKKLKNDSLIEDGLLKKYLTNFDKSHRAKIISNKACIHGSTEDTSWFDGHYDGYWLAKVKIDNNEFEVWGSPSENQYYNNRQTAEVQNDIKAYLIKKLNLHGYYRISITAGIDSHEEVPTFLQGKYNGSDFFSVIPAHGSIEATIDYINADFLLKKTYSQLFYKEFFKNHNKTDVMIDMRNYLSISAANDSENEYIDDNNTIESYSFGNHDDCSKENVPFEYHSFNGKIVLDGYCDK